MKAYNFLLIIMILISLILSGCYSSLDKYCVTSTTNSSSKSYKLNNRQKSILKQEGLSTDYNKLNPVQKSSIEAIETMLCYLEKKYPNESFMYNGYVGTTINPIEREHLIADSDYGKVTVYREFENYKPVITDNFNKVKAGYIYADVINKYVDKLIDDNDFVISVNINKIVGNKWETKPYENCNAYIKLYFNNEKISKRAYTNNVKKILTYLSKNAKKLTTVNFALIKNDAFYLYVDRIFNNDDSFNTDDFIKYELYYNTDKHPNVFNKD